MDIQRKVVNLQEMQCRENKEEMKKQIYGHQNTNEEKMTKERKSK